MSRWLLIPLLIVIMVMPVEAQVRTTSVDLGDEQTATIIPLYRNFDFFYDSIVNGSGGEFSVCAEMWPRMNRAFNIEIPDDPRFQYIRRWDVTSDTINDQVPDVIEEALIESAALLPGADITVCLVPAPPEGPNEQIVQNGIYAIASGNVIIMAIGRTSGDWRYSVANVIAHEYHHTVRNVSNNRDLVQDESNESDLTLSLLERVVSEGMAVIFAQMVAPDFDDPVYVGLNPEQETALWTAIVPEFRTGSADTQQYFMLGGQDGIPYNAGYSIGYYMMQSFIANNPDIPLEEWTVMNSVEVYEASGYNP